MTDNAKRESPLVTRGQGMTRDNYRVREGVHGEWCVDEAAFLEYRFVARAASELEARRLCAKLNGHPIPVRELGEPKPEPLDIAERAKQAIGNLTKTNYFSSPTAGGISQQAYHIRDLINDLDAAGLRIVEKKPDYGPDANP